MYSVLNHYFQAVPFVSLFFILSKGWLLFLWRAWLLITPKLGLSSCEQLLSFPECWCQAWNATQENLGNPKSPKQKQREKLVQDYLSNMQFIIILICIMPSLLAMIPLLKPSGLMKKKKVSSCLSSEANPGVKPLPQQHNVPLLTASEGLFWAASSYFECLLFFFFLTFHCWDWVLKTGLANDDQSYLSEQKLRKKWKIWNDALSLEWVCG